MNARKRIIRNKALEDKAIKDKPYSKKTKNTRQKQVESNCIRQTTFAEKFDLSKASVSQRVRNGTIDTKDINGVPHIYMDGIKTKKFILKLNVEGKGKGGLRLDPDTKAPIKRNDVKKSKTNNKDVEKLMSPLISDDISDEARELVDLKTAKEKLEVEKLQVTVRKMKGELIERDYVMAHLFSYLQELTINILNMPSDIELEYRTALDEGASSGTLKKILTTPIEIAISEAKTHIKKKLK